MRLSELQPWRLGPLLLLRRHGVALAFAALGPPALLVADEPTGQLDRHAVDEILDAIHAPAETGMAIVAATHDLAAARRAHQVIHLRDGRVEEALSWT